MQPKCANSCLHVPKVLSAIFTAAALTAFAQGCCEPSMAEIPICFSVVQTSQVSQVNDPLHFQFCHICSNRVRTDVPMQNA